MAAIFEIKEINNPQQPEKQETKVIFKKLFDPQNNIDDIWLESIDINSFAHITNMLIEIYEITDETKISENPIHQEKQQVDKKTRLHSRFRRKGMYLDTDIIAVEEVS